MKLFRKKNKSIHNIDFMKKYVLGNEAPFRVVESYKTIRTNLQYVLSPTRGKVIAISSSNQGERKSSFSANIAIAFAEAQARVLLIDADMRKPVMHKLFELDNSKGLAKCLAGFERFNTAVHRNVRPNLDILTSGSTPPNPSELLASKNADFLLDMVKDEYDYIIIDTPPINIVTDAVVLSKKAAGVVLVANYGKTSTKEFKVAVDSINLVGSTILGVVIMGTPKRAGVYAKYTRKHGSVYAYYNYDERD
jgi:capsular exopolysaccharide synthesis family protein